MSKPCGNKYVSQLGGPCSYAARLDGRLGQCAVWMRNRSFSKSPFCFEARVLFIAVRIRHILHEINPSGCIFSLNTFLYYLLFRLSRFLEGFARNRIRWPSQRITQLTISVSFFLPPFPCVLYCGSVSCVTACVYNPNSLCCIL